MKTDDDVLLTLNPKIKQLIDLFMSWGMSEVKAIRLIREFWLEIPVRIRRIEN